MKLVESLVTTFFALSLFVATSSDDELTTINQLREDLFIKQKYDRNSRPVKSHLTPTVVNVAMLIASIADLDIRTGVLTLNAIVGLSWKDEHLSWNPDNYHGIQNLVYRVSEVWVPDFTQWDEAKDGALGMTGLSNQGMTGKSSGKLEWYPSATYKTHCGLDLTDYPFDKQICTLEFVTRTHYAREVNLTLDPENKIWGPMTSNSEYHVSRMTLQGYKVSDYDSESNTTDAFSVMGLNIYLDRRTSLYTYYVVIPYLVATILALTVFALPLHSKARLAFSGMSILVLVLLMMFVGNMVGTHSIKVPYAVKCIGINVFLVGLALVASQLNARMFLGLSIQCPPLLVSFLTHPILSRVLCLGSHVGVPGEGRSMDSLVNDGDANGPLGSSSKSNVDGDWSLVAFFLDRVLLVIYSMTILIYHS